MMESKGCGGLFSSVTDRDTKNATVEHRMDAIGNCMSVIDMVEGQYINFVAEVRRDRHAAGVRAARACARRARARVD